MSLLGDAYGRAAAFRRGWYERRPDRVRRLARPVISVGNLTVGGSGKTPVVAALARVLGAAGQSPSILTRGYGRRRAREGVVVVGDGDRVLASVAESGDEPQMLARALPGVPVLVSSDRYLAGRLAESRLGCTVHLLDDGFQHVQLARDIDLLVMSPADTDERLLPWGRLRESLATAAVADALLVAGGPDLAASLGDRLGVSPVFHLTPRYGALRPVGSQDPPQPSGRRVVAVAGIAKPERFFGALREATAAQSDGQGFEVAREMVFRDHHWFSRRDVVRIEQSAVEAGAGLVVTTEKDAVRLEQVRGAMGTVPWAYLPMDVDVEPKADFTAWLAQRLRDARTDRGGGLAGLDAAAMPAAEGARRSGDGGEAA